MRQLEASMVGLGVTVLMATAACETTPQAQRDTTGGGAAEASLRPVERAPQAAVRDLGTEREPVATQPTGAAALTGHFLGTGNGSRVVFETDEQMVHVWNEGNEERREAITTEPPRGERECKVLRSNGGQDFLLCMYWFTGPGGGRVDGVLYDLKRRIRGEFFSAAVNTQLHSTLCYPETMAGPMPSFNMVEWSTEAATPEQDAEIRVVLERKGWSTQEAKHLRSQPVVKQFCGCLGAEDCANEPAVPVETKTLVYTLARDQLSPTKDSRAVLQAIAAQWGHHDGLKAWNLAMRRY